MANNTLLFSGPLMAKKSTDKLKDILASLNLPTLAPKTGRHVMKQLMVDTIIEYFNANAKLHIYPYYAVSSCPQETGV